MLVTAASFRTAVGAKFNEPVATYAAFRLFLEQVFLEGNCDDIVTGNTIQFLNGLLAENAAGEVQGQVENGQQSGQSQPPMVRGADGTDGQGQENQGQSESQSLAQGSKGEAPPSQLKANEEKAYRKFIAKGRNRDFEFLYHTPSEVEVLKQGEILKELVTQR